MRIKLNLDSLAMMLFCARLKAYKEVPLTTDEWQMVEPVSYTHLLWGLC